MIIPVILSLSLRRWDLEQDSTTSRCYSMGNTASTVCKMEEQERRDAYVPLGAHSIDHSWWIVVHFTRGGEIGKTCRGGVEVSRFSDRRERF
jgi:hypothetical protein